MEKALDFLKSHKTWSAVIVVLILMLLSFAAGRYTVPTKVITTAETKTETKDDTQAATQVSNQASTQESVKVVYVYVKDNDIHKETDTIKHPDGTVETKTVYDDKSTTTSHAASQASETTTDVKKIDKTDDTKVDDTSDTKSLKVVDYGKPQWHLGLRLGGGVALGTSPTPLLSAGLQAERRILGPVFMGLWADVHANAIPFFTSPYTVVGGLSLSVEF
jgi:hypothetical protein